MGYSRIDDLMFAYLKAIGVDVDIMNGPVQETSKTHPLYTYYGPIIHSYDKDGIHYDVIGKEGVL